MRQLRADPEANRLFIEILTSRKNPEMALRRMNEAGVFGRFIPDFGRVVAQMQYDMYHVYTVDEHTLFAIGILHQIESGALKDELPLATAIAADDRVARAPLSRDAAARHRQGPRRRPFRASARRSRESSGRVSGFTAEETETVAWLVRWHLLMSGTAFKLDIDDPQTIADFVERVQSPERLKLLLVLTVADIRAVGPKVWNGWKAALLRELYHRALDLMSGGLAAERARFAHRRRAGRGARAAPRFHRRRIRRLCQPRLPVLLAVLRRRDACPPRPPDARGRARPARRSPSRTRVDTARAVTEITLYTADHPGLFSRIAGALAVTGANIVDAKIMTMSNGMALDTFWVQDQDGRRSTAPTSWRSSRSSSKTC